MSNDVVYRFLIRVVALVLGVTTRRRYRGLGRVPTFGGALVVCNHISVADPLVLGHALSTTGRLPRGMATAGLFRAPVVGRLFTVMGHIPVLRGTETAGQALAPAAAALRAGELLVCYPEGGIGSGDQWPGAAKTGAARLALSTGVPVVPVAQWGAQRLLPPRSRGGLLRVVWAVVARPRVEVLVGEPFVLCGDPENVADVRAATEALMGQVTALLEQLRGPRPVPSVEPVRDAA